MITGYRDVVKNACTGGRLHRHSTREWSQGPAGHQANGRAGMSSAAVAVRLLATLDDLDEITDWLSLINLLQTSPSTATACSEHGTTALHLACRHSKPAYAALLLARGASTSARSFPSHDAFLPLHLVIQDADSPEGAEEEELVRLLLRAGADVDGADGHGSTALMMAAQYGRTRAARALVRGGAWVGWEGGAFAADGMESVLYTAVCQGEVGVVRVLAEEGRFEVGHRSRQMLREACIVGDFLEVAEVLEELVFGSETST